MYSCGWNIESFPPWVAGLIGPPLLVLTKWTKKHNRLMKKRKTAKSAWNYAWKFTYFLLFLNRGVNVLRNTIRGSLSKARITCSSHRMLFKLLRTEWKLCFFLQWYHLLEFFHLGMLPYHFDITSPLH